MGGYALRTYFARAKSGFGGHFEPRIRTVSIPSLGYWGYRTEVRIAPTPLVHAWLRVALPQALHAGISGNLRDKVQDYPRVFTTLAVKSEKSPPHWYGGAVKHADVLKAHLPVEPKAHLSGRARWSRCARAGLPLANQAQRGVGKVPDEGCFCGAGSACTSAFLQYSTENKMDTR